VSVRWTPQVLLELRKSYENSQIHLCRIDIFRTGPVRLQRTGCSFRTILKRPGSYDCRSDAQCGSDQRTIPIRNTPTCQVAHTGYLKYANVNDNTDLFRTQATNCRTGPGQSYEVLFTLLPGASVEIAGRYPTNNYWTVKVEGLDEPCWMWGEYATPSGSYWAVPSVTPPATLTPGPPNAPSFSNWEYSCGLNNATVTLKWNDRSDDESGYRIYRNDKLVTELPPNSTAFSEVIDVEVGENITYRIEVFNGAGASSSSPISFSC